MGLMVGWSWLVLGASVPLVGSVADADGRPIAGAAVMLGDTNVLRTTDELIAATTTDAAGTFRLDRPADMAGRGGYWSPTLWVYAPGQRVAFREFKRHVPTAAELVRFVLHPTTGTPVRVLLPDGKPAPGARVQPSRFGFQAPSPPSRFGDRLATTTGLDGRATLDGLGPEDLTGLDVTGPGMVTQATSFWPPSTEPKVVAIMPEGRLAVRVTADDPAAAAGWVVSATTSPNTSGTYTQPTSTVSGTTDPRGLASYPPLAAGRLTWYLKAPAGSPFMAEDPLGVVIRPGELTEVTIPLRTATRVVGTVITAGTGQPIAGVRVNTHCASANLTTEDPITDASGRFTFTTLTGKHTYSLDHRFIPLTVYVPPDRSFDTEFVIPDGALNYTMAPIELRPAVLVTGTVVDDAGRPAGGIDVQGTWRSTEFPNHQSSVAAMTDDAGHFVLGGIAPHAQLSVSALIANRAESAVAQVTTVAPPGANEPLTFQLRQLPAVAVSGRVVGPAGLPVSGARVHVQIKAPMSIDGTEIDFTTPPEVTSRPDGTFETPPEVPVRSDYRVQAEAPGFTSNVSAWADKDARRPVEVRLVRNLGSRTIAGRVLDPTGVPVAGVDVFQAGDGPQPTRSTTDAAGRFEVTGVAGGPAFLFARSPAHRLTGQLIPVGATQADLVVTRRDAPAPARLVATPITDRPADRALAREFVTGAWKQYLSGIRAEGYQGDRPPVLEMMARLEPDRIEAMLDNQVIPAEPAILAALVADRVANQPDRAIEFLATVSPPSIAAPTYLTVFETWHGHKPAAFERDLLTQAEARCQAITDPLVRASLLIRLASAWATLGDRERAGAAARAADQLAGSKSDPMHPIDIIQLAHVLAPTDYPAALRRLDPMPPGYSSLNQAWSGLAGQVAVTQPAEARRLLDRIDEKYAKIQAAAGVAIALARAGRLAEAREVAAAYDVDPTTRGTLPAIAAQALDPSQAAQARAWLGESFQQLATLTTGLNSESQQIQGPGPLVAMALLVPVAVDLDPDGAAEYFWLTLAARPPHPFDLERRPVLPWTRQYYLNLGAVANILGRYDRAAAEAVFAGVAARIPLMDDAHWGLGSESPALFRTAAAFDSATARAMWAALPADPPRPPDGHFNASDSRHTTKADAEVDLAYTLSLPPALRVTDALRASNRNHSSPWLDALLR